MLARVGQLLPEVHQRNRLLVALDFGQALPSLSQEFLFAVFDVLQLPQGLTAAPRGLYSVATATGRADGITLPLCRIFCGTIQCCALSGSPFAASASPFLEDLRRGLEAFDRGTFRA
eukprot:47955-Pyramimonas_sp.AAC.1